MSRTDFQDEFKSRRDRMVDQQLRVRGIRDDRVLAAMAAVPRHEFLEDESKALAYEDRAIPIAHGQTMSQPYIVAKMTEVLEIEPGHRVLELGTGSGYQAAVLSALGATVISVERVPELSAHAEVTLKRLNITNVTCITSNGSLGFAESAPYDRIIVTAAAPTVPQGLVDQLAIDGRMVIPVGADEHQLLVLVRREAHRVVEEPLLPCRFVPLIGKEGWPQ